MAVDHQTTIHEVGEGGVPAACAGGWRSLVFGAGKTTGMMDPPQPPMLATCTSGKCPCGGPAAGQS